MLCKGGRLPIGYTELEYFAPNNKLTTNIVAALSKWEIETKMLSLPTENQVLICSNASGGHFGGYISTRQNYGVGDYLTLPSTPTNETLLEVEFTTNGIKMTYNGTTVSRSGTNHTQNATLFASDGNAYKYSGVIYSVKCIFGGQFNGIPAKRNIDDHIGLYDLANGVFYDFS